MTRMEALAIARLWHGWVVYREDHDLKIHNRARREFVFRIVGSHPKLRHLNCFEVLDAVTNEAAWQQHGQTIRSPVVSVELPQSDLPAAAVSADHGVTSGNTSEHGARRQPATARVVEIKQTAY